jgi:hypothetical protein
MKKNILILLILCGLIGTSSIPASAENTGKKGNITGKSVLGGVLSLLIWPGIGQAINDNEGKKVATHAIVGLIPPFRIWSCYDAVVDRQGGYWNGKI